MAEPVAYGAEYPEPPAWQLDPDGAPPPTDEQARSWRPRDIESVLDGTYEPPLPTVGARSDGVGMFYLGRKHTASSESEGGKTWMLLAAAMTEIERGNSVVYIDGEDDEGGVVGRLLAMQLPAQAIRERFAYIRPEERLDIVGRTDLAQALGDMTPTFVALDGITELMVLHGLDPLSNKDAATFGRMLPTGIAKMGPAVCSLDHVPKSTENRGRYSIGAVHKLNGLDGAAYVLDNRHPFGIGLTGKSTIKLAKDRPGQLRRHGLPSAGGMHWFGDLILDSQHEGFVMVDIEPPEAGVTSGEEQRPTALMAKVATLLADKGPLSKNVVENTVRGKAMYVRRAIAFLQLDGYVSEGTPLKLLKPYTTDSSS